MVWGPTTVTPTNMAYGFKTLEMYHFESLPPLNMWPGSSAYDSKALGTGQESGTQKKEVVKRKSIFGFKRRCTWTCFVQRLKTSQEIKLAIASWLSMAFHKTQAGSEEWYKMLWLWQPSSRLSLPVSGAKALCYRHGMLYSQALLSKQ